MKHYVKRIVFGVAALGVLAGSSARAGSVVLKAPNQHVAKFFNKYLDHPSMIKRNQNGTYEISCFAINRVTVQDVVNACGTYKATANDLVGKLARAKALCA